VEQRMSNPFSLLIYLLSDQLAVWIYPEGFAADRCDGF